MGKTVLWGDEKGGGSKGGIFVIVRKSLLIGTNCSLVGWREGGKGGLYVIVRKSSYQVEIQNV